MPYDVAMSNLKELEMLAGRLTEVMPPPLRPMGVNKVVDGSGRWKVVRIGAGQYAIRAEYDDNEGGQVEVRMANEVRGYVGSVAIALRFSISVAEAGKLYWSEV